MKTAPHADVNEIVIYIRKRTPAGTSVFGSVSQDILLNED